MRNCKEWLNIETYEYKLAHTKPDGDWLEIPEGMNYAYKHDMCINFTKLEMGYRDAELIWQRATQPEELPFIDDEPKYTDAELKYMDEKGQGRSQSLNDQYAEIERVRQASGGVDATLAERQSTYGNFEDVAFVTENIMAVLGRVRGANGLQDLPNTHRMALYMIASKMARIVNGDFNHLDSWHDIGGYAKLVEKLIYGE